MEADHEDENGEIYEECTGWIDHDYYYEVDYLPFGTGV